MNEIRAIIETGVYADDLDRAEAFYRDVLGLEVIGREPDHHVFFRVGPATVLLVFNPASTRLGDRLPAHGATGPGHFALGIPAGSVGYWRHRLGEHGVTVEQEVDWPRGGHSLYFRDPAGNAVELLTPGVWGLPTGW